MKILPKKIYVIGGGGLGDLIREYLGGQKYWGYLEEIKKEYPDIKIKAILSVHNPQATEFLKCNPCLEKIEQYPWQQDGKPIFNAHKEDYVFIKDAQDLIDGIKYRKPKVYLTDEEEKFVKSIQDSGKYIFIHPFAGLKDRIVLPIEEYPGLIDKIIEKGFFNVIVVGASYKRTNRDSTDEMEETFTYQRKGLFNLVNRTNARVAVRLVQGASGFIGAHSCYVLVAWDKMMNSVLIVPEAMTQYLHSEDANAWVVRAGLRFNKTIYINGKSNFKEIEREVLEWIT